MEYCKMRHAIVDREKCQIECWARSCCGLVERFHTWENCKDHNLRFIQSAASCRSLRDLARASDDEILAKLVVSRASEAARMRTADQPYTEAEREELMRLGWETSQLEIAARRFDELANVMDLAAIAADEYEDTVIVADSYNAVFAEEIATGESAEMKPADITMKDTDNDSFE